MGAQTVRNAAHVSQFAFNEHGTCGQTAASVCLTSAFGWDTTAAAVQTLMEAITNDMRQHRWCAPNGAATTKAIYTAATQTYHAPVRAYRFYDPHQPIVPFAEWHNQIVQPNAGKFPIWLQVLNGKALVDRKTGARDQWNLQCHAIAVVGYDDALGYQVADGDNGQITNSFVWYTRDTLAAAQPSGYIVFDYPAPPPASQPKGVPDGWGWDAINKVLTAGSFTINGAIAQGILAWPGGWDAANTPQQAMRQVGSVYSMPFLKDELNWDQDHPEWGVYRSWLGQEVVGLRAKVADLEQTTPPPLDLAKAQLMAAAVVTGAQNLQTFLGGK